jgi:hypothetical protein
MATRVEPHDAMRTAREMSDALAAFWADPSPRAIETVTAWVDECVGLPDRQSASPSLGKFVSHSRGS